MTSNRLMLSTCVYTAILLPSCWSCTSAVLPPGGDSVLPSLGCKAHLSVPEFQNGDMRLSHKIRLSLFFKCKMFFFLSKCKMDNSFEHFKLIKFQSYIFPFFTKKHWNWGVRHLFQSHQSRLNWLSNSALSASKALFSIKLYLEYTIIEIFHCFLEFRLL